MLIELTLWRRDNKWEWGKKPVFQSTYGKIVALELDHDNPDYMRKNQLFVID